MEDGHDDVPKPPLYNQQGDILCIACMEGWKKAVYYNAKALKNHCKNKHRDRPLRCKKCHNMFKTECEKELHSKLYQCMFNLLTFFLEFLYSLYIARYASYKNITIICFFFVSGFILQDCMEFYTICEGVRVRYIYVLLAIINIKFQDRAFYKRFI